MRRLLLGLTLMALASLANAQYWRDPAARGTAAITSGTIDNTVIGGTTPAAGTFTSLTASSLTSGRIPYASTGGLLVDSAMLTTTTANGLDALSIGTGSTTNAGLIIGYRSSGFGGIWATKAGTPSTSNYALIADGTDSYLNSSSSVGLRIANSTVVSVISSGAAVTGTLGVTGQASFAAGSVGTPSIAFAADTNTGLYNSAADELAITTGGTGRAIFGSGIVTLNSGATLQWGSSGLSTPDTMLVRDAAAVLALKNSTTAQGFRVYGTTTGPKYVSLSHDGTNAILDAQSGSMKISASGLGTNYIAINGSGINYYNAGSGSEHQIAVNGTKYFGIGTNYIAPQTTNAATLGDSTHVYSATYSHSYYSGSPGKLVISGTAPTISSGFGTSPSIASNNGTPAFTVNVGTGGTASSGVIGMPTATTGWNCHVENRTGVAANRADQRTVQTATTTTTVTVQNQTISTGAALAWTASDVLALICFAY